MPVKTCGGGERGEGAVAVGMESVSDRQRHRSPLTSPGWGGEDSQNELCYRKRYGDVVRSVPGIVPVKRGVVSYLFATAALSRR